MELRHDNFHIPSQVKQGAGAARLESLHPRYAAILENAGLDFETRGPWASVGVTTCVQGWKLHISSVPTQAVSLLERVVPLLANEQVAFKFVRTPSLVAALNEGGLGDLQTGKFLTAYPPSDARARTLAEHLIPATAGYNGPIIVTDLRLGDVVYARYGGFNPVVRRDRLGQVYLGIYDASGLLTRDSYRVPFETPAGVVSPFGGLIREAVNGGAARLFGPGYRILETWKTHSKGCVFLALDLRNQEQAGLRAIKQGRQHCFSDEHGRDMRTRLRRQQELSRSLARVISTPVADEYFEVNDHGYLPLEWVEGTTLLDSAVNVAGNYPWGLLTAPKRAGLLASLRDLAVNLRAMHEAGYAHRDLSPTNIVVRPDCSVCLLDLELAHRFDSSEPPYGKGTPGYMSPEQERGTSPDPAQDVFSFGCLMILLLTGADPLRVLDGGRNLRRKLRELSGGANPALVDLAAECTSPKVPNRPPMTTVATALGGSDLAGCRPESRRVRGGVPALEKTIGEGALGILSHPLRDEGTGLWLSGSGDINPATGSNRSYELRRDAHHGVAGIVYTIARLVSVGCLDPARASDQMLTACRWLVEEPTGEQPNLPGLYFGDGGVAVALQEARLTGFAVDAESVRLLARRSAEAPLDWNDMTHGAAGQGIVAMLCESWLEEPREVASRFIRYLRDTQQADGSWRVADGVDGLSGRVLTGFAHGCAGIVYYLAACDRRFGFAEAEECWRRAAEWLIARARQTGQEMALEWPYSDTSPEIWKWWCHGSPGIALAFLRLYQQTQYPLFADTARRALNLHGDEARSSNLSTCHGLAGLGEVYLEAAAILDDKRWLQRAETIARTLLTLARRDVHGRLGWLVEDAYNPTADLMVGSAGVLHFLARVHSRDTRLSFPMLLPMS